MRRTMNAGVATLVAALVLAAAVAAQAQTTTATQEKGQAEVTSSELTGIVVRAGGNDLVVKLASGEVKTIRVPADRKFEIDGAMVSVGDLKPGTLLAATITTTATPATLEGPDVEIAADTKVVGTAPVPTSPAAPAGTPAAQTPADRQSADFEGEEGGGPMVWVPVLIVALIAAMMVFRKLKRN